MSSPPNSLSHFQVRTVTFALPTELLRNICQESSLKLDSWFRQRSTFPGSLPPSIIDAKELNFRVRDGNGWGLLAITTGFALGGYTLKTKQCIPIIVSL